MRSFFTKRNNVVFIAVIILLVVIVIVVRKNIKKQEVNPENDRSIAVNQTEDLYARDSDNDGLKDWEEVLWNTDPNIADTNGNGVSDGEEVRLGRNPITSLPLLEEETTRLKGEVYADLKETKLSKPAEPPTLAPSNSNSGVVVQNKPSEQPSQSGNPNLINLDLFLSAVRTVGLEQGYKKEQLDVVETGIRADVATTTNLREGFNKARAKAKYVSLFPKIKPRPIALGNFFNQLLSSLGIIPKVAKAQIGDSPFGGALYFTFFCTCTGNWLVLVQPLAPTYVVLLTYYEGTQEYQNYNTPFTSELLGFYSGYGQCEEYIGEDCVEIPSEGEITGTVGSAAF